MISIDGIIFDVKAEITREAMVTASEISGMILDGSYFNDVLGTYMQYEVRLLYPLYDQNKYAALYEKLTEPVEAHAFILPYNNSFIALTARVETIQDTLLEFENGRQFWRDCSFAIIANAPSKSLSLSEVITRGRAPLPDVAQPAEGATYTYTNGQWVPAQTYADADLIAY